MIIKSQKDFLAGVLFLVIGAGFAFASLEYRLGTPARMGPGFFPLLLGILLALLGAGVIVTSLRGAVIDDDRLERLNLRGLGTVVVATIVFALCIQPLGLLVTLALSTTVASFASSEVRPLTILANIGIQLVIGLGIFHLLLGLQIPLLPTIFGP